MRQHSTPVRRVASAPPVRPARPVRRRARFAAAASLAACAAVLAVALSGCGIRDTAVPVDAGDPASRTACPPGPSAALTALENDASLVPSAAPTRLWPPMTKEEQDSAAAAASSARAAAAASAKAAARAGLTPSASATESDGTLSCLHPSGSSG